MKTGIRILLPVVALFLIVFAAIATNSHFSKAADDRTSGTGPQWGWELVSVHGSPNDPVYFFKRLKDGVKEGK